MNNVTHRESPFADRPSLYGAREKIAQARRELWWFIETYTDEDNDTVARAISIQDDLLAPALGAIEGQLNSQNNNPPSSAPYSLAGLEQTANGQPNENGYVSVRPNELHALIQVVEAAQEAWVWLHARSKTLPTHALRVNAAEARVPLSIALEPFGDRE